MSNLNFSDCAGSGHDGPLHARSAGRVRERALVDEIVCTILRVFRQEFVEIKGGNVDLHVWTRHRIQVRHHRLDAVVASQSQLGSVKNGIASIIFIIVTAITIIAVNARQCLCL